MAKGKWQKSFIPEKDPSVGLFLEIPEGGGPCSPPGDPINAPHSCQSQSLQSCSKIFSG